MKTKLLFLLATVGLVVLAFCAGCSDDSGSPSAGSGGGSGTLTFPTQLTDVSQLTFSDGTTGTILNGILTVTTDLSKTFTITNGYGSITVDPTHARSGDNYTFSLNGSAAAQCIENWPGSNNYYIVAISGTTEGYTFIQNYNSEWSAGFAPNMGTYCSTRQSGPQPNIGAGIDPSLHPTGAPTYVSNTLGTIMLYHAN